MLPTEKTARASYSKPKQYSSGPDFTDPHSLLSFDYPLKFSSSKQFDQLIDRTCHMRINCLARADRNGGLQHRTPPKDPSLEDEPLKELPGLGREHCMSSSQRAGGTIQGAKVPRNQDAETKPQLLLLAC